MQAACTITFGSSNVFTRKPIASTLGLGTTAFPARCLPDVAVRYKGRIHICEVKSSRVEYPRFDNVLDSKGFRDHLASRGHRGAAPWEVEQDILKLRLFGELSKDVGTCLLLFVDAFRGKRSWTAAFHDPATFRATVRTDIVKAWSEGLIAATTVVPIRAAGADAQLIACMAFRRP